MFGEKAIAATAIGSGPSVGAGGIQTDPSYASHISISVIWVPIMKTTLKIDDTVMAELKREAARQGRTMSDLVETALRLLFRSQRKRGAIPVLPTFRSGGTLVDIADRDALYHAMEGR